MKEFFVQVTVNQACYEKILTEEDLPVFVVTWSGQSPNFKNSVVELGVKNTGWHVKGIAHVKGNNESENYLLRFLRKFKKCELTGLHLLFFPWRMGF